MLKPRLFLFCLFFVSCSGLEHSEQEKIRRQNAKGEYIYRRHSEILYPEVPAKTQVREPYPWEA